MCRWSTSVRGIGGIETLDADDIIELVKSLIPLTFSTIVFALDEKREESTAALVDFRRSSVLV